MRVDLERNRSSSSFSMAYLIHLYAHYIMTIVRMIMLVYHAGQLNIIINIMRNSPNIVQVEHCKM